MNKNVLNEIILKMVRFSERNLHDIEHFLKVHAYARLIGEMETENEHSRMLLETAAVLHDIACPLCREKYGSARGELQEREGMPMCRDFLKEFELDSEFVDQVAWLVGHHHTIMENMSLEHRILLEADLLVNAKESGYPTELLSQEAARIIKTNTGKMLLHSIYDIKER